VVLDLTPLQATDAAILQSIGWHRYLDSEQIRVMHLPGTKAGSGAAVSKPLSRLEHRGLITGRKLVRSGKKVWSCTLLGLRELDGDGRLPFSPSSKGLRLARHTWAVNEVGISLLRSARQRGDDFGVHGWDHEIPLRRNRVIADALIRYTVMLPDGRPAFATALLEVDRATYSPGRLGEKLRQYADVRDDPRLWAHRFPQGWPFLLFVVDAADEDTDRASRDRLERITAYSRRNGVALPYRITTLGQIRDVGPFAPIWSSPQSLGERSDWLGRGEGQ